jgi:hypothetical protein
MLLSLGRRLFTRRPAQRTLCESCGEVCDARCRALASRDRTRTSAVGLALGIHVEEPRPRQY